MKLCINCKHCQTVSNPSKLSGQDFHCLRQQKMEVSLLDGKSYPTGVGKDCLMERHCNSEDTCGGGARFFEPKEGCSYKVPDKLTNEAAHKICQKFVDENIGHFMDYMEVVKRTNPKGRIVLGDLEHFLDVRTWHQEYLNDQGKLVISVLMRNLFCLVEVFEEFLYDDLCRGGFYSKTMRKKWLVVSILKDLRKIMKEDK